ncbi:hypothetical protein Ciccas_010519, partial [Cichlidogyrus casuarinus]
IGPLEMTNRLLDFSVKAQSLYTGNVSLREQGSFETFQFSMLQFIRALSRSVNLQHTCFRALKWHQLLMKTLRESLQPYTSCDDIGDALPQRMAPEINAIVINILLNQYACEIVSIAGTPNVDFSRQNSLDNPAPRFKPEEKLGGWNSVLPTIDKKMDRFYSRTVQRLKSMDVFGRAVKMASDFMTSYLDRDQLIPTEAAGPTKQEDVVQVVDKTLLLLRNALVHEILLTHVTETIYKQLLRFLFDVMQASFLPDCSIEQALMVLAHLATSSIRPENDLFRRSNLMEQLKLFMRSSDSFIKAAAVTAIFNLLRLSDTKKMASTSLLSHNSKRSSYLRYRSSDHERTEEPAESTAHGDTTQDDETGPTARPPVASINFYNHQPDDTSEEALEPEPETYEDFSVETTSYHALPASREETLVTLARQMLHALSISSLSPTTIEQATPLVLSSLN